MSETERPELSAEDHIVTIEEVRALVGGATPHFSLHLRNRLARLVAPLPADDMVRKFAESQIARLKRLAVELERAGD